MMNIRHVQVSLDKIKKFANEMDKTQYDYDYVIISSILLKKETFHLNYHRKVWTVTISYHFNRNKIFDEKI